jgi:hypothetical protein
LDGVTDALPALQVNQTAAAAALADLQHRLRSGAPQAARTPVGSPQSAGSVAPAEPTTAPSEATVDAMNRVDSIVTRAQAAGELTGADVEELQGVLRTIGGEEHTEAVRRVFGLVNSHQVRASALSLPL